MSLTITTPTTGNPFGPGFTFQVTQSDAGPFPAGSFWQIELEGPPGEVVFCQFIRNIGSVSIGGFMKNGQDLDAFPTPVQAEFATGQPGRLRVRFFKDGTGYTQDDHVDIVIDRTQGQVVEQTAIDITRGTGAGQGLTEDEHNAVLQTNVGVIAMTGLNPLQLVGDIVQAIAASNPLGYGSLTEVFTISGDGELPYPDPILPKWGLYWIATVIPAGLSHFHGQSEEYLPRLVQWRTTHIVGGTEMVTEVRDSQTHGELWRFAIQSPARIEYSIIPGAVLQAQYWQFP